jgi:hypothetical protein
LDDDDDDDDGGGGDEVEERIMTHKQHTREPRVEVALFWFL